jgi:hypothetical protein
MKRIVLLLLIAFSAVSCDLGDGPQAEYVIAPVQDVTMATAYKVDSISKIIIRYTRPDDCHIFNGYYYVYQGNTRVCAVEFAKMLNQDNCQPDVTVYEVPLNFKPTSAGTYLFRFWDGTNADGTDHFFEAEAIVNN